MGPVVYMVTESWNADPLRPVLVYIRSHTCFPPALWIKSKLHTRVHKPLPLWQLLPFQPHGTALPCSSCSSPGVDKLQQRFVRCWWNAAHTFFCVCCLCQFQAAVAELGGWGRDCDPQCYSVTPNGMGPGKWGLVVAPRRRNGLVHQLAIFAMCLVVLKLPLPLPLWSPLPSPSKVPGTLCNL